MGKNADDELDETVFEAFGDTDAVTEKHIKLGPLLVELVKVARSVGDYKALRQSDSKYAELLKNLRSYWRNNPRRKVVLFSFYRHTLNYLSERLLEDGIKSVLVYGGMDKQAALKKFADPEGPDILLSSEVASEGVDLQFSSLLINYDLPWNPMRIEQRIGRIDRIGQEAKKILIWNFMYADTIDDRVYVRLLERLDIFKRALGSIEAILGEEIRELGYKLLTTHSLTPEQEEEQINLARVAIETTNRNQDDLESQATQLIAHGDYIQNKVKAARELGRYICGEDLFAYVRDFLDKEYEGTRLIASDKNPNEILLELSIEARVNFEQFLSNNRLQGRTKILTIQPPRLLFENQLGSHKHGVERVTQDHPLVRFVSEQLTSGKGVSYFPVSAIELHAHSTGIAPAGLYVYAVSRWTLSGSRDLERLEYIVWGLENATRLRGEDAERLVNIAAMEGKDWLGASNVVNHSHAADIFSRCQDELEDGFNMFTKSYGREDRDRIDLMVNMLERHRETQREKIEELINRYQDSGNERLRKMIPAEEGRLKKQKTRINEKIEMLRIKEKLQASDSSFVSGGVIRIV